jgi:hypothetical protein
MNMNGISQMILDEHGEATGLNSLTYNKALIDKILVETFPENLPSLPTSEVITMCAALSQFISFLQYSYNCDGVIYREKKRVFDKKKRDTMIKFGLKAKSNEEMLALACDKEPELVMLEEEVFISESRYNMSEDMANALRELINTMKRELDRRYHDRQTRAL